MLSMHQQPLPVLSLELLKNLSFNQQFCYFCSKLLQFFAAICFPNSCWTWISAPWTSTLSSYLSYSWSTPNKKFVFASMNKNIPGLTDLLHPDPLNGKNRGTPLLCARLLYSMHVRRVCNSQIRVVMLEDLFLFCNHTCFSQHPDVMQASTDLIWQLHLYFQQSESKLPTVFMTGCRNTKSWMKAETWVDELVGPCQHISLVS